MVSKLFACLMAALSLAIPSSALLASFPYHIQSFNRLSNIDDGTNFGTGNCWTAASDTNGAAVTLQKCQFGSATQSWTFIAGAPAGEGTGPLGIVKIFGNKCLDVTNGVDKSGTKLQIYECSSTNKNQQWAVTTGSAGVQTVKWANSTRCIDLTGGSQSSGTPIQIWTCQTNSINQQWISQYALPAPPAEGSTLRFLSALTPGATRELCVFAASEKNNAAVHLDDCDIDGEGLNWVWAAGSLKTFGDLCLDVTGGKDVNGTPLQVYKCSSLNANQQWKFHANYSIQWVGHNKCIDLTDGKLSSGTQLQVYSCSNGNNNQRWEINPVATSSDE